MLNFYPIKNLKQKLYINSGYLGIGEFNEIFTVTVSKGYYSIYQLNGSLIIMPEKYNIKDIINKKFTLTEYDVSANAGLFSFINSDVLNGIFNEKMKKIQYSDKYFNLLDEKDYSKDYIEIYGKNLIKLAEDDEHKIYIKKYIENNKLSDKLVAYYARNFEGTGIYCTYRSENIFIICDSTIISILDYFREIYNIYDNKSNK